MSSEATQFDFKQATEEVVRKIENRMNSTEFFTPNVDALRAYADRIRKPKNEIPIRKLNPDVVANTMVGRAKILMSIKSKREESYEVDSHNIRILTALKWYAMRDERFESEGFGSLHKGLCLQGLQGCGKTMMLKIIADSGNIWEKHEEPIYSMKDLSRLGWGDGVKFGLYNLIDIHSCVRIEHDYRANGEKIIQLLRSLTRPMVFDDLGFERSETLNFGNRVNIMEQMIQHRYDLFIESGTPTHFSTNLVNGDEVERIYGPRTRSRLREMCNFLLFDVDSHIDRRK